jgi:hypothetical protein
VDTSTSAKRVAKVAKQSAKARVRTQRGLLFPVTLAVTVVLGTFLVVYARQSKVTAQVTNVPPTLTDNWSIAYGVYHCDKFLDPFKNNNDIVGGVELGVNTNGDGVIAIAPKTAKATGRNAKFGLFLSAVGVEVNGGSIKLPEDAGSFTTNTDKCGDKSGRWKVAYWADANQSSAPNIFVADFKNIRFTQDRGAIVLAFVPDDADLAPLKPPSVAELAKLDAAAAAAASTTTTVAGDTSSTTAAGSTATTTSATTTGATTTGAATTGAATTTTTG